MQIEHKEGINEGMDLWEEDLLLLLTVYSEKGQRANAKETSVTGRHVARSPLLRGDVREFSNCCP